MFPVYAGVILKIKEFRKKYQEVFPVYAGVIPTGLERGLIQAGVPRVCGGDPIRIMLKCKVLKCSPCMRG